MNLFDENFNLDDPPEPETYTEPPNVEVNPPAKIDWPSVLTTAKQKFNLLYKQKIESLRVTAKAFEIKSDADAGKLTAMAGEAAELTKQLEEKRKVTIKEPDSFVRSLNAFVKTFRDPLSDVVKICKQKIGTYQFEKELERRKKEKKAQDEAAKLQAKMDAEAKAAGVEAPELPPVVMPEKTAPIRTESGSANFSTEWVHELEDITKVPWEYLLVNDAKVKLSIKAGIRDIPGLIIKEVPKIGIRTR